MSVTDNKHIESSQSSNINTAK